MFLLNSCTEEREYIENNNRDLKFEQKPFKDLILLKDFNTAYQRVKTEKQKNVASRSALENEYNFTIKESEEVKIVEVDNKTFYNILIERDSASASYFENLVFMVEKIDNVDEISAYILKYGTPNGYMQFDYNADKDVTPLFERISQECYKVCVTQCHDLREGTIYAEPHAPGAGCNDQSLIVTNCYSTCDSTAGTQFGMGNTTTNGSLTGGDTQNTGSGSNGSTEIVTAPVYGGTLTDGETPCQKIFSITNKTEYKNKFNELNKPEKFALTHESGFAEVKVDGVVQYIDGTVVASTATTDSMLFPPNTYGYNHVHINDTYDIDTGFQKYNIKIQSPKDLYSMIHPETINIAVSSGATPYDVYNTMISKEGIMALTLIDPNINYELFNQKYNSFKSDYYIFGKHIVENTLSAKNRKEKLQKMMLNFLKDLGLDSNVALFEATVKKVSIGGVENTIIQWSRITLDANGNRVVTPC